MKHANKEIKLVNDRKHLKMSLIEKLEMNFDKYQALVATYDLLIQAGKFFAAAEVGTEINNVIKSSKAIDSQINVLSGQIN